MSPSNPTTPRLDHIVILLSHATLTSLPSTLTAHLTISPGGDHANGITTNKLILFPDGVYIELIAFFDSVTPEQRKTHRWGDQREGTVVDFAYTLEREAEFPAVQADVNAADAEIVYADPQASGRTREDGTVLRWATSDAGFEDGSALEPGLLPFWCLDRTDRKLRVPYGEGRGAEHPSRVSGVRAVVVKVPEQHEGRIAKVYDAVHQSTSGGGRSWDVAVPAGGPHGGASVSLTEGSRGIDIVLKGGQGSPSYIEVAPGLRLVVNS